MYRMLVRAFVGEKMATASPHRRLGSLFQQTISDSQWPLHYSPNNHCSAEGAPRCPKVFGQETRGLRAYGAHLKHRPRCVSYFDRRASLGVLYLRASTGTGSPREETPPPGWGDRPGRVSRFAVRGGGRLEKYGCSPTVCQVGQ